MDMRYTEQETGTVAQAVLDAVAADARGAGIIALSGDLGAGKTTLAAAVARALGVTEQVVSPTFVIAKFYPLEGKRYDRLVHIDAYRIESPEELVPLQWNDFVSDPNTLVIIEWPERIEGALPHWTTRFTLTHHDGARHITSR
jgi:tRNA threonylcarbamoyladenosine biosynthesis protein TsaE